jgi:hypothetical protein
MICVQGTIDLMRSTASNPGADFKCVSPEAQHMDFGTLHCNPRVRSTPKNSWELFQASESRRSSAKSLTKFHEI